MECYKNMQTLLSFSKFHLSIFCVCFQVKLERRLSRLHSHNGVLWHGYCPISHLVYTTHLYWINYVVGLTVLCKSVKNPQPEQCPYSNLTPPLPCRQCYDSWVTTSRGGGLTKLRGEHFHICLEHLQ